jgi:hypothetical protein
MPPRSQEITALVSPLPVMLCTAFGANASDIETSLQGLGFKSH